LHGVPSSTAKAQFSATICLIHGHFLANGTGWGFLFAERQAFRLFEPLTGVTAFSPMQALMTW
jgi:hypothetical protein